MSKSLRTVLLIDKSGTVKEIQVKQEDIPNNLYKKAGLKTPEDFTEQFVWELNLGENGASRTTFETEEEITTPSSTTENYSISIYGKKVGKHSKNAYGFPPPLEETNLYGNCILVNNRGSITLKEWNNLFEMIYEKYEAEEEDDEAKDSSSEDDGEAPDDVEDDVEEDDVEEDDVEEDDEANAMAEKNAGRKRKNNKKAIKTACSDFELTYTEEQFLDCEMELEPEEYLV